MQTLTNTDLTRSRLFRQLSKPRLHHFWSCPRSGPPVLHPRTARLTSCNLPHSRKSHTNTHLLFNPFALLAHLHCRPSRLGTYFRRYPFREPQRRHRPTRPPIRRCRVRTLLVRARVIRTQVRTRPQRGDR
jgi:hypothetical protein